MIWWDQFAPKVMTAEEAVKVVESGDRVWFEEGCGTPKPLIDALVKRAPELRDVELCHMLTFGEAAYTRPEYEGHFRHNGLFLGGNVRRAIQEGRADYTPIFLSEIEDLFRSGQLPIDVAFIQTSPPDEHGYLSLGTSVDCTLTAAQTARIVIAEV
ncbi:MAG: 4-hydroxybutyrate CoA-transferase, partial [Bryobacteraceae bacterium]